MRAGKRGGAGCSGEEGRDCGGQPAGGARPLPQQNGPAPRCPRRLAIGEARCPSRPATAQRTSSTAEGSSSESCRALGAGGLRGAAGWTRRALGWGLAACSHDPRSLPLRRGPGSLISYTVARSCGRTGRCRLIALGAVSHSLPRSWEHRGQQAPPCKLGVSAGAAPAAAAAATAPGSGHGLAGRRTERLGGARGRRSQSAAAAAVAAAAHSD